MSQQPPPYQPGQQPQQPQYQQPQYQPPPGPAPYPQQGQPPYPQYPPYQQPVIVQQRKGLSGCAITLIVLGVVAVCSIIAAVGLFGLGLLAVTNPTTAGTSVTPVAVGQQVAVGSWRVTVENVGKEKTIDWSGFGNKETAKGEFVEVFVAAQNTTNKTDQINSFDYELVDSSGAHYAACTSFACANYPNCVGRDWFGTQVPPRTLTRLLAMFDVSTHATGLQLVIEKKAKIDLGISR